MTNPEYQTGEEDISPEKASVVLGYRTYMKELPSLLDEHLEGHMVAYDSETRLGIAPTDEDLHQLLVQREDYADRMRGILVTRITELDLQDGMEVGPREL